MIALICIGTNSHTLLGLILCVQLSFLPISQGSTNCKRLNTFISCYETPNLIIETGFNAWNNKSFGGQLALSFYAFGKDFELLLVRRPQHRTILSQSVKINHISSVGKHSIRGLGTKIQEVEGILASEDSQVTGVIKDNRLFYGVIHTNSEVYYLEPRSAYLQGREEGVIIYKNSDVNYWSQNFTKSPNFHPRASKFGPTKSPVYARDVSRLPPQNISLQFLNARYRLSTQKLSSNFNASVDSKICHVHVVSDHTFFRSQGMRSDTTTVAEIVNYLMDSDDLFRRSDFDGDGLKDNIGFQIDEITIYKDASDKEYFFGDESMTVELFLDKFSLYDFDDVCLGIIFTHRDFDDGVIGLAWMGSSSYSSAAGGICQDRIFYHDPPFYGKGYYSFNTLLVSTLNYGHTVPQKVASLTVTHEFGHSFGSPHDNDRNKLCAPGDAYGNYIMHPFASDANKPNNFHFSICSKAYINPVLINKGNCLETIQAGQAICGDRFVDEGEDCDCGSEALCKVVDKCCQPPSVPPKEGDCTFPVTDNRFCSPKLSACCNADCQMYTRNDNKVCMEETDCASAATCDGTQYDCPQPKAKSNGSPCNDVRGICQDGLCSMNLCLRLGLSDCQCSGHLAKQACMLCCQCPNSTCVPAQYLGLRSQHGEILHRSPGQACNKYKGYCDENGECVTVDVEAAWDRLATLFSKNTAQRAFEWFQNYWYLLIAGMVTMGFVTAVFQVYRKRVAVEPVNTLALQSGKMAGLWQKVNEQQEKLFEDLKQLDVEFNKVVEDLYEEQSQDFFSAIARMHYFSPTAPYKVVHDIVRGSSNEDFAVQQLLLRNYPMARRSLLQES